MLDIDIELEIFVIISTHDGPAPPYAAEVQRLHVRGASHTHGQHVNGVSLQFIHTGCRHVFEQNMKIHFFY